MLRADEERLFVATYKEIAIVFISFAMILFFLYPKDILKENVLTEESNYDLSVLYLKNMLRHDPQNEVLMLALAKKGIALEKNDLAQHLLETLLNSDNREIRYEAHELSYLLTKQTYLLGAKEELHARLQTLFGQVMLQFHMKDKVLFWYEEALFLERFEEAKKLLDTHMLSYGEDIKMLQMRYYLAQKKGEDPRLFLHKLQQADRGNRDAWLMAEYYYLNDTKRDEELIAFLKLHAKENNTFEKYLLETYVGTNQYKKASAFYLRRYIRTKRKEELKNALQTLVAGDLLEEAVALAQKYEPQALEDKALREYLLKLYISASQTQKASDFAKKILEAGR